MRSAVRRRIEEGSGGLGQVRPAVAEYLARADQGEAVREEYRIRRAGGWFEAVLLRPATTGPHPAVIVCPGLNAVVRQVTGTEPPDFPDRDVAARLTAAGFVTLTLDYGFAGSLDPVRLLGQDEATVLAHLLVAGGHSLLATLALDAVAALSWLDTHASVQRGRVGLFGHSLGAAVALHAALCTSDEVPVCLASHLGSYRVLGYGHPGLLLPGITRDADLPDLMGALAPAPLHVQYGLQDPQLDPEDAALAGRRVAEVYRMAGADGDCEVRGEPMGHATAVEPAIAFLARALDRPRRERTAVVPPIRVTFDADMRRQVADTVEEVLQSGVLTLGATVAEFEERLAPWTGGPAVAVDSGSSALEIVLRHLDVAGRVVLVPVNTFFATAAAAVRAGAKVDFVDLEPEGLGLAEDSLSEQLDRYGERVAAVLTVHTGGIVAPSVHTTLALCRARGIPVVEDAAHAFGSSFDGRPAGGIADFGAYSFYPTKVLTTAEGGAVTARSATALDAFRRLRDHGRSAPGATTHDSAGSNWRLSELHAAVGLAHLEVFAAQTARRAEIAAFYDRELKDLPGLRIQRIPDRSTTSWYKYIVELPEHVERAALKKRLRTGYGVALAGEVYDLLLTEQPFFAQSPLTQTYPSATRFAQRHACLPIYPSLTTADQGRIIEALREELS